MTDDEKDGGAPCARLQPRGPGEWPMSRRDFVKAATVVVGASTLPAAAHAADGESPRQLPVSLTINGEQKQVLVDPRTSLLDLLREDLKLTGTKKGCDHGQCGACTVLVNAAGSIAVCRWRWCTMASSNHHRRHREGR